MHQITYRIRNLAPIIISAKFGDSNMVSTLKYIPGTSVLGMLAARFISKAGITSQNACEDDDFYHSFLGGGLAIGNGYILFQDGDGDASVCYPTPFSVHKEKDGEQIYDLLHAEKPEKATKAVSDFSFIEDAFIHTVSVETGLNFHHARDSKTGAPKEEVIFNYESVSPNQVFEGTIRGDEQTLKKLVDVCGSEWIGYIGRSKNAQYGKVCFEVMNPKPGAVSRKECREAEISLTLLSDTIVYNSDGYSCTDIKVLEEYLGMKIKKAFIRKGYAENFIGVWGMKKPSENCFLAGSCFLLDTGSTDSEKLKQIQEQGIGERCHEGFGQCVTEWQTAGKLSKSGVELPRLKKPDYPMPDMTKNIFKTLIRNAMRKQTETDALTDLKTFSKKFPSNAAIGRLAAMSSAMNREEFTEALGKLRETAKSQLERCRNDNETLLEFLKEKNISAEDILRRPNLTDLTDLCSDIGYKPQEDTAFAKELYQTYMGTFFSIMRKSNAREVE
ncbi:MAG: hypothetical protein V2I97_17830 [Desulfococcaceae bacterium]|jgi:CRISPR-associated protein Csx10|nr:hypothetical protein [Desulfococcaceae bacterium]